MSLNMGLGMIHFQIFIDSWGAESIGISRVFYLDLEGMPDSKQMGFTGGEKRIESKLLLFDQIDQIYSYFFSVYGCDWDLITCPPLRR